MMKTSRKSINAILVALLTYVVCASAQDTKPAPPKPDPDLIVFTNGDQLTGTLIRGVGDTIVFKSDMAGEITVSVDKVKQLRSNGSFALLRKDVPITRTPVHPGKVDFADGNVTIASPSGPAEVVPVKNMSYLIDQTTYDREMLPHQSFFKGWNGGITGGAALVRSTTNASTYNAAINLVRAMPTVPFLPPRNRTTFNLLETYGKQTQPGFLTGPLGSPDVITKTSIFHADAERDEYFSPKFYALGQISFDHNYSQGLDLQAVYGGGLGWTPIKTEKRQLDLKADLHYESQHFFSVTPGVAAQGDQHLIGSTFSEAYRQVLPRKMVFTEFANVLPAWNNMDAYSANAGVALLMPVFKRLGLTVGATDNYLNNPQVGYKSNSFQFLTGVTYSLR